ncbi:MAG: DNA repair protein RecO [Balneolaceae bacterium]
MSLITKTGIIVLRTIEYSESSLISTVLSREHGKISLIAKGARRPRSKFSGMLQPGQVLEAVYYFKPTRSVQTLTEASYLHRLEEINRDVEKMAVSMCALELVSQLIHEGDVNEAVFTFARNFLVWLDLQETVNRLIFPYLQVRLAFLVGLELQIEGIDGGTESGYLNIGAGTVSKNAVSDHAIRLSKNQLQFLKSSAVSKKSSVLEKDLNKVELRSLIEHLDKYFRYHFEGVKPRSSDAIFDQILKG